MQNLFVVFLLPSHSGGLKTIVYISFVEYGSSTVASTVTRRTRSEESNKDNSCSLLLIRECFHFTARWSLKGGFVAFGM